MMRVWMWKHLDDANYDVRKALDALVKDIRKLTKDEHKVVHRTGLQHLLQDAIKARRIRVQGVTNGPVTMPMFAALVMDGRLMRVAYANADIAGLRALVTADEHRVEELGARLLLEKRDLALYEKHPELPSVKDVWDAEGIEYEIVEAAEG